MNDSVTVIVSAFFVIGIMVGIIAVIAIGIGQDWRSVPQKTSVRLDTLAVSAATVTARVGSTCTCIWNQSDDAGPDASVVRANAMETEDMETEKEQCYGISQNPRTKGDRPPG
jgi:hypothetical protein